jgi:putative transposase
MGQFNFSRNKRFLWNGTMYLVLQVLPNDRLIIENVSFGGVREVSLDELITALFAGEIVHEISTFMKSNVREKAQALKYKIEDFGGIPETHRNEAYRRYQLIVPLLKSGDYSRNAIRKHIENLYDTNPDLKPKISGRAGRSLGSALSCSSVERWLRAFLDSNFDVRSLVPYDKTMEPKNIRGIKNQSKKTRGKELIDTVFDELAATPARRRIKDVTFKVRRAFIEFNDCSPDCTLSEPSDSTIRRRIKQYQGNLLNRPAGRLQRKAEGPVFGAQEIPTFIMECVELDSTLLDIIVVDEQDCLPIGRPVLQFAIDSYSGYPVGFDLSYEPPSYRSVMRCLRNTITKKPNLPDLFRVKNQWYAYGLPKTIVVDNGREYVNYSLIHVGNWESNLNNALCGHPG